MLSYINTFLLNEEGTETIEALTAILMGVLVISSILVLTKNIKKTGKSAVKIDRSINDTRNISTKIAKNGDPSGANKRTAAKEEKKEKKNSEKSEGNADYIADMIG